jgi:hypothetical protein
VLYKSIPIKYTTLSLVRCLARGLNAVLGTVPLRELKRLLRDLSGKLLRIIMSEMNEATMPAIVMRCAGHLVQVPPHTKDSKTLKLLGEITRDFITLHRAVLETLEENAHLADGDICTLKKLKDAVGI